MALPSTGDPTHLANPYRAYRRLRDSGRVHWDENIAGGAWLVMRYADVASGLRDARLSADRMPIFRFFLRDTPEARVFDDSLSRQLLFLDPPRHTSLRALVSKAFTPRMVERLRPRVEAITDALLDGAEARGSLEVIGDLAYPLPVTVIAELLGLPAKDHPLLKRWSQDLASFIGSIRGVKRAIQSEAALRDYLLPHLARRRACPQDDLLSALVTTEDQGTALSEADVLATCVLLLMAGHETTTHFIGNGLLALLRHPQQHHALRENPSLMPGAIEELFRYEPTAQVVTRVAREDMEVGGQHVSAGQMVVMVIGSANRDPDQFAEPESLDIHRREVRHLTFASGIHFCLGAPLARLEGAIVLSRVLQRWPRLRVATEQLEWQESFGLRGLKSLPLVFD